MDELLEGPLAVAHLLRRAGFGPDPATWASLSKLEYEDVVDKLIAGLDTPVAADPDGFDAYVPGAIGQLWLERMLGGRGVLAEKLALFWHGHFATSQTKIKDPQLMWTQYKLFREKGAGPFDELVLGVAKDVAMIRWLDGNANRKGHANENWARELQELFTLGIGNYTEEDIREIARAFTGWGSRHHDFVFRAQFHDDGPKTFHGKTGNFDGDDVVEIITELPACATFICRKLLVFFSHPEPTDHEVEALAKVMREQKSTKAVLRAMFLSPSFRSTANYRVLVRSPVEFCIGGLLAAGVKSVPPWIHGGLDRMGQIPFHPPSVKGWTSGTGWLSSGAVVERLRIADRIAGFTTKGLSEAEVEAAAKRVIDTAFQGDVPPKLQAALQSATGKDRIATALGSPEFQLS